MTASSLKKTWVAPQLRSEQVQETLTSGACSIKINAQVRGRKGQGRGIKIQTAFS